MANAAIDIPNLLHRYAEAFDDGDFAGAAGLFGHGGIVVGDQRITDAEAIAAMWRQWVHLYEGKPRTRHLVTNPIITLSDDGHSAACRSQWTVLQATDSFALQLVATGRYHDRFALIDGAWQFTERHYAQVDLVGDASAHMRKALASEET